MFKTQSQNKTTKSFFLKIRSSNRYRKNICIVVLVSYEYNRDKRLSAKYFWLIYKMLPFLTDDDSGIIFGISLRCSSRRLDCIFCSILKKSSSWPTRVTPWRDFWFARSFLFSVLLGGRGSALLRWSSSLVPLQQKRMFNTKATVKNAFNLYLALHY